MKKGNKKSLKTAARLFRSRKFSKVINFLEPQVFMYRDNFTFYYILGVSCLYTNDYGGAYSYLKRAAQLNPEDNRALQGLAAVHLKRGEIGESIRLWLSVLDVDPNNNKAKRALALLRKNSTDERFDILNDPAKIKKFFPKPKANYLRIIIPLSVLLLAAFLTAAFIYYFKNGAEDTDYLRPGSEQIKIKDSGNDLTDYSEQYRYVLTEDQIRNSFKTIGDYFNNYRDNLAMKEINRILHSNASPKLKERLLLLHEYIQTPDFTNFRDNFSYDEVSTEPYLYNNCFVRWKGKVSNLAVGETEITFDFLVGYHNQSVVEGIVPVRVPFAAKIENGDSIELIGEVQSKEPDFFLAAVGLRPIKGEKE